MDEDDLLPRAQKPKPRNLDPMSIAQLGEYISELEAEIERVRAEIARKTAHRDGAEALFRK